MPSVLQQYSRWGIRPSGSDHSKSWHSEGHKNAHDVEATLHICLLTLHRFKGKDRIHFSLFLQSFHTKTKVTQKVSSFYIGPPLPKDSEAGQAHSGCSWDPVSWPSRSWCLVNSKFISIKLKKKKKEVSKNEPEKKWGICIPRDVN